MWLTLLISLILYCIKFWLTGRALTFVRAGSVYFVWVLMLTEYSAKAEELHCRVADVFNYSHLEKECSNKKPYVLEQNKPIFTSLEQYAVHTLNYSMAFIGYIAGYKEVAFETAMLSWLSSDIGPKSSNRQRVQQCDLANAHYTHTINSLGSADFFLSASYLRKAIANVDKNSRVEIQGITAKEARGGVNNDVYSHFLKYNNLRVPLALYVNSDTMVIERKIDETDVIWQGPILYPSKSAFKIPSQAFGLSPLSKIFPIPEYIPLYESVFCGMQMDGAMTPYIQLWKASINPADERLSHKAVEDSERTWFSNIMLLILKWV
ncbi:hypothetical protein [Vibrio rarus]|uniref:hypothetical protein n=1 Tax=Vibrio rarus TaxID=413403 RepID=UPI0021C34602|nr:hypothetical protein [Vibrio rarus]